MQNLLKEMKKIEKEVEKIIDLMWIDYKTRKETENDN